MLEVESDTNSTTSNSANRNKDKSSNPQTVELKPLTDYPRVEIDGVFLRLIAPDTYFIEGTYF